MDRPTPPPFISLRPINGLDQSDSSPQLPVIETKPLPQNIMTTLKPLADRLWFVPWLVLGVITWKWVKEKLP